MITKFNNRRNGFTLIELVAVLFFLAIIVLIIVLIIIGAIALIRMF